MRKCLRHKDFFSEKLVRNWTKDSPFSKSGALDKVNSDEMEVELVMVWQAQSLAFFSEMFSSSYMKLYTTSTNKRKMRIPQIKYEILNTSINQQKIRHGTSSKEDYHQSEEQQGLISYFTIAS
ncbi:unnamed protein product [Rhizophagus irregularis]|nr:unnamed protein product [Rhizophagus irregularis]